MRAYRDSWADDFASFPAEDLERLSTRLRRELDPRWVVPIAWFLMTQSLLANFVFRRYRPDEEFLEARLEEWRSRPADYWAREAIAYGPLPEMIQQADDQNTAEPGELVRVLQSQLEGWCGTRPRDGQSF
jgi:hypothetical protein